MPHPDRAIVCQGLDHYEGGLSRHFEFGAESRERNMFPVSRLCEQRCRVRNISVLQHKGRKLSRTPKAEKNAVGCWIKGAAMLQVH
jgi:hypothetical protein